MYFSTYFSPLFAIMGPFLMIYLIIKGIIKFFKDTDDDDN